jgi:predicted kinase
MLIIFGGLPGTGKTTLARMLAGRLRATYLRIDSIEQAFRDSKIFTDSVEDAGYRVGYAVAEDNLLLGYTVVADSVNPEQITRDAWRAVATRARAKAVEIEVVCSDVAEHRRRVESRQSDIVGLSLPSWRAVSTREYEPWSRAHIVIDTAHQNLEQSAASLAGFF